jgi:hypothetical protein
MLNKWLLIMVCNAEQVVVSHGELCSESGCESSCVMLSQWLWVMVSYAEPVVVNHGLVCCAKGCELWRVILSQWLFIMMCIAEQVIVNHGEFYCSSGVLYWVSGFELCCGLLVNNGGLYRASGCESLFVMLCQSLWVMVSYIVARVWTMVCNAEPVVVNHGVLCWTSGCESWCVMLWPVTVNHGEL